MLLRPLAETVLCLEDEWLPCRNSGDRAVSSPNLDADGRATRNGVESRRPERDFVRLSQKEPASAGGGRPVSRESYGERIVL